MKCVNCGAEVEQNATSCSYCGMPVDQNENNQLTNLEVITEQDSNELVEQGSETSLIGKQYSFVSAKGTNLLGLFNSRIFNEVQIGEDRIGINTIPSRYNKVPAIMLEDITAIQINTKINFYYWIWIIISILCAMGSPICLIFTVLFFIFGRHSKIKISQRNGKDVILYSHDKELAMQFKEDMKKLVNIF